MRNSSTLLLALGATLLLTACSREMAESGSIKSYADLADGSTGISNSTDPGSSNQAGVITAGEWNDHEHWEFWLELLEDSAWQQMTNYWQMKPVRRIQVQLVDQQNRPLADVQLSIPNGYPNEIIRARTDNRGNAVLFPNFRTGEPFSGNLTASYMGQSFDLGPIADNQMVQRQLPVARMAHPNIDLMFIVDATGSMGDEMEYLKTELKDVIEQAQGQHPNLRYRYGSLFYRDEGDEYVTRLQNFQTDPQALQTFISQQSADGGGDFPEAVDQALESALQDASWSPVATNRLAFLLLDAPPHHTDRTIGNIRSWTRKAAEAGIKLIPITASGIDKETEFLMRFIALGTNGTYVFITDHSGIGNDHLEPTVGPYEVEYLNQLLLRLINENSKTE